MFKFLWTLIIEFVICLLALQKEAGNFKSYKRALWPHNARALANQIARYIALIL